MRITETAYCTTIPFVTAMSLLFFRSLLTCISKPRRYCPVPYMTVNGNMKSMIPHDDARLSTKTSKKEKIIISASRAVVAKTKMLRLVSFRESLKAFEGRMCLIWETSWVYTNSTTTTTYRQCYDSMG